MDNSEILEERKMVNKAQKLARAYHVDDTTAVLIVLAANLARINQSMERLMEADGEKSLLRVCGVIDTFEQN